MTTIISIPMLDGRRVVANLADIHVIIRADTTAALWVKGVCVGEVSGPVCNELCACLTEDRGYLMLYIPEDGAWVRRDKA